MKNIDFEKLNPGGRFGRWFEDESGLPAYEYTCDQDSDPAASSFTTQGPSNLHWHQIGNDRITAIASNRGEVQAIESSRGLQWLNYYDPARLCPGAGIALVIENGTLLTDLHAPGGTPPAYRRIFGCGYFRKINSSNGLEIDHRVITPFGDDPVLIGEIVVTNKSDRRREPAILEFFGVNLHYMSLKSVYATKKRKHYGPFYIDENVMKLLGATGAADAIDADERRTRFAARFGFEPSLTPDGIAGLTTVFNGRRPPRDQRNKLNYYPYPLFAASLIGNHDILYRDAGSLVGRAGGFRDIPADERLTDEPIAMPCLCPGKKIALEPGESKRAAFIFGIEQAQPAGELVERYRRAAKEEDGFLSINGAEWQKHLPVFELPGAAGARVIEREARWHAYYSRSAFLHDEYYENHYLPQGGPYEFLHGFRGAPRDLALFLMGIIYTAPARAAELLEYCFRMMMPNGRIIYAAYGFGMGTGAVVHDRPSDLQLFLLWALAEYLFFTRDYELLDRETPFFGSAGRATIREKTMLALDCLFNEIGTGEHGLIRAGDGDWSDGISLFAGSRSKFVERGESVFNSAMALYVLPRVADLLDDWNAAAAARTREFTAALKTAVLDCFNGKWFYRAYDGTGKPIGDKEIFLEHHVWLLISRALPDFEARSVIRYVREKLDAPSSFGQYILYPPKKTLFNILRPGWDVNGGVWFAMNYLLAWGYGLYDRELGWNCLLKNSMVHKATVDPNIWYGIWSGPDSFNANHAERPGETYFHIPTPCTDFPVMNLNLHAGFLAALVKLCGVEPSKNGIDVRPLLPFDNFRLRTPAFDLEVRNRMASFRRLV
jgi:hypothetical protein